MARRDVDERIGRLASLGEPQRWALYRFVVNHGDAASKGEAAEALGIARSVAGFHLDRLVADGLLATEFRRLTGRRGPGAGRPAKLYRRVRDEVSISLPPRRYDFAAAVLAQAVDQAIRTGTPVEHALSSVASKRGRDLGEHAREAAGIHPARTAPLEAALATLEEQGYEPRVQGDEVVLANCPFHALVDGQRDLVCSMHLDLLSGMAEAVGKGALTARLEPSDDACCVRFHSHRPGARDS
jgi:predicted ArsR family transcriptional regulator